MLKNLIVLMGFILMYSCKKEIKSPEIPNPVACFNTSTNFQKPNETINFTNCSENFDSVEWDFGDGTFSTEVNPSHSYSLTGVYNVTLKNFKSNKVNSISKKIAIATQVQIDYGVLLKNFKGTATTDSFYCKYFVRNSKNQSQTFLNNKYPPVINSNYSINFSMNGLYFSSDPKVTHSFIVLLYNAKGPIDSAFTESFNILDGPINSISSSKLNCADANFNISLIYK